MIFLRLVAPLFLSWLSGCAAAERTIASLTPDQLRAEPVLRFGPVPQNRADERARAPKAKIAKQPKAQPVLAQWPEPVLVRLPEPVLPPWRTPPSKPERVSRYSLTPSDLFKKLNPFVYTVAVVGETLSQGSAVAISSREALTNCHVVSRGRSITLSNGAATVEAEVAGADMATDRCLLRAKGDLQAVPAVREYASLVVGEIVYTIGSPKGLVNTLGSGLLSGLRTSEDKTEYIQITAPVSEGSSGGGLFDERGNLIGITTFTIRDSQNINFAIAASQFWK